MTRLPWILLVSAGCTIDGSAGHTSLGASAQQVALVPAAPARDLDLLLVIDDSVSMLSKQQALVAAIPSFVSSLESLPAGMPSLHIGVASTDLGTSASLDPNPGPSIGSGPGSCFNTGRDGVLATSQMVTGAFISDIDDQAGGRTRNYTGTLAEAFASIASLGAEGCGFEQPLRAAVRALGHPANSGFVRDTANLAILMLSDEDDCSLAHGDLLGTDAYALGPLQSFRCTRFGVTCAEGGEDPREMNHVGSKTTCQANESVGYLTSVAELVSAMKARKSDPRTIMFGAMVAPATSLAVELRPPPGGGTAIPSLAHACGVTNDVGDGEADPAVRITNAAAMFPRSAVSSICEQRVDGALLDMTREIRGMFGDRCLTRDIRTPARCEAYDTHADGSEVRVPECAGNADVDCFRLVTDPTCAGQGLRVDVVLSAVPAADTMLSLRCAP